ncbi:hypothetical protein ABC727_003235 [Escherichia coli]
MSLVTADKISYSVDDLLKIKSLIWLWLFLQIKTKCDAEWWYPLNLFSADLIHLLNV